MILLIYNTAIAVFNLLIALGARLHTKAAQLHHGRKQTWQALTAFHQQDHQQVVWVHAASLGEFEQGRPIIEQLKTNHPEVTILLTFFSPSGYEVRKNYTSADLVVYLPADTKANAKRFLELANPKAALFIKYEFWYHYLNQCHQQNVLTLSVSSIFRREQPFFKFYGSLHRQMLYFFNHIFVQDKYSEKLLNEHDIHHVDVCGDTRFDRVADVVAQMKTIPEVEAFKAKEKMWVLGSVWPSDMEVILPFLLEIKKEIKLLIAPHNIGPKDVAEIADQLGEGTVLFSEAGDKPLADYRTLIVDNMGMLSSLYGYGEFAYIGGAFRQTLHNTLEAAAHGVPVFFGNDPTNKKFREAGLLTQTGAGIPIASSEELRQLFVPLMQDEKQRKKLGSIAAEFVSSHTGATPMIVNYLQNQLQL